MLPLYGSIRFPGPLIYERDLYLAWTLKRSRAVCGQTRVVGVVGRGHLAGVMRAIASDRGGDTLVRREHFLLSAIVRHAADNLIYKNNSTTTY